MPVDVLSSLALGGATAVGMAAQRATGFGFALVSVPLFGLLIGAGPAIALCNMLFVPVNLVVLLGTWRGLRWGLLRPFVPAGLLGAGVGVLARVQIPDSVLMVAAGATVILLVLRMLWVGRQLPEPDADGSGIVPTRRRAALNTGLLSGLLQGATAMGGPPMVVHAHRHGWPSWIAVPSMQCFNVLVGAIAVGAAGFTPSVGTTDLGIIAVFLLVGSGIGAVAARLLPAGSLLRMSAALAIAGGGAAVLKGLGAG